MNDTTPFTLDKIIQKWNAAMRGIHDSRRYKAIDRPTESIEKINAAGQALSSVIEYAIKMNMYNNWSCLSLTEQNIYNHFSLPKAINSLYEDSAGNHKCLFLRTIQSPKVNPQNVDFSYLRSSRDLFSNNTAHKAIDLLINDVETAAEKIKMFLNCYITNEVLKKTEDFEINSEVCARFYESMDGFESSDTLYILINDSIPEFSDSLEPLSRVNWDAVLDFDGDSFSPGHFGSNYSEDEILHLIKPADMDSPILLSISPFSPAYYMALSWKGHDEPAEPNPWKKRMKKAATFIEKVIKDFGKNSVQQVFVLSLLHTRKYNSDLITMFETACGEVPVVKYFVISDVNRTLAEENPDNVEFLNLSLHDLCEFLDNQLSRRKNISQDGFRMPYRKDDNSATGCLTLNETLNYSRFFEILHSEVEKSEESPIKHDFYIGKDILSWRGASEEWPVVRESVLANFIKTLRNKIKDGKKLFLLKHSAGIGGTTFARQAAFMMHATSPTIMLKKYDEASRTEIANLLQSLYDKLKLPMFVFAEIPEVMERNEMESLANKINDTRPIMLIGVIREELCGENEACYPLPDWGKDFINLSNLYKGLIRELPYEELLRKTKIEMCDRLQNEKRKLKTPFELGLITFDKEYKGITQYVANFHNVLKNYKDICEALIIMALCDIYGRGMINNRLIREVFKEPEGKKFNLGNKFPSTASYYQLISEEHAGGFVDLKIRHPLLSIEILRQFKGMDRNNDSFKNNLLSVSKRIIDVCADAGEAFEGFVTNLFINRDPSREDSYSRIVTDMPPSDRIPLFQYLVERFPNNAHFHSHLGRCYSLQTKEYRKAIEHVEKAIELSPYEDFLLYHMKAECLSRLVESQAKELTKVADISEKTDERGYSLVTNLKEAEEFYDRTRNLQEQRHKLSGYGYDGHISMLINVLNSIKKLNTKNEYLIMKKEPFTSWIETAESLLVELQHLDLNDSPTEKELLDQRVAEMHQLVGDYSKALQYIQNQLDRNQGSNSLRRLLVGCHILRYDHNPHKDYRSNPTQNIKLLRIIEENLNSPQVSHKDFNLWLDLIRFSDISVEECASNVMKWSTKTELPYVHLFNFAIQTVLALNGNTMALNAAKRCLDKCQAIKPNNTIIREWVGTNTEQMQGALVQNKDSSKDKRGNIKGIVSRYERGSEAYIKNCNLEMEIFFKPDRAGLDSTCLNKEVTFNLGISYDGLIAENVRRTIE